MPEGHVLHRLARDLGQLRGRAVSASSPQGKFVDGAAAVDGAVLERAEAYGKHLLLGMDTGGWVHVHLGMQGTMFRSDPARPPVPQARLRLATAETAWDLVAPARCELLSTQQVGTLLASLGPDPLRPDADVRRALAALGGSRSAIAAALLDQSLVAGVGNVFRSEALHAVGVSPARPGRSLSDSEVTRLWKVLQQMMARAVDDGRIVTVEGPDRLDVPEGEARKVYRQERCRDCGAPVVTSTIGGRTSYHCPVEQPD